MAEPRKVAIVHDWLVGGGAELVVEQLHKLYPDAPIYTSYATDEWRRRLDGKVVTGWLQHFGKLRKFIPFLRIWWFEHLDLSGYDLVISSSGNGEAFGVKVPQNTLHVNYCHSPTHFYWRHYDQYLAHPGFGVFDPLARLGLRLLVGPLRRWDLRASKRPDYFIANSSHIRDDIKRYYDRDSTVIFPPVDVDRFTGPDEGGVARQGFVNVGRQQPYKRNDIIVRVCSQLNLSLTMIGSGPDNEKLKRLAGPSVIFVSKAEADDQAVARYMRSAEAFIFASHEDFGVTPVEAMAAGTPVIAYKAGGALDYVEPGKTGEFFDEQTPESLLAALKSFKPKRYDPAVIRNEVVKFSAEAFRRQFSDFIAKLLVKQGEH